MAYPQLENGYIMIARELYDNILLADLTKNELSTLLVILRFSYGYKRKFVPGSIKQKMLAEKINIDPARLSKSLKSLVYKNFISIDNENNIYPIKNADLWKLDETSISNRRNVKKNLTKRQEKLDETSISNRRNVKSHPIETQATEDSPAPLNKTLNKNIKTTTNKIINNNNVVVSSKISEKLLKWGLRCGNELAQVYGLEKLEEKIKLTEKSNPRNPAGFLLKALENNYIEPLKEDLKTKNSGIPESVKVTEQINDPRLSKEQIIQQMFSEGKTEEAETLRKLWRIKC